MDKYKIVQSGLGICFAVSILLFIWSIKIKSELGTYLNAMLAVLQIALFLIVEDMQDKSRKYQKERE